MYDVIGIIVGSYWAKPIRSYVLRKRMILFDLIGQSMIFALSHEEEEEEQCRRTEGRVLSSADSQEEKIQCT